MTARITIAIDGHSSTGKSTLARQLAKELQYIYVDSGAMYRCVTLFALKENFLSDAGCDEVRLVEALAKLKISFNKGDEDGKNHAFLNGEDVEQEIRSMYVSGFVSKVAAIPQVRRHLVALQQEMGLQKGVVMDGRDIGTVVFPDAELKIFMTADAEVRAQRRYEELKQAGKDYPLQEVLANVIMRDQEDSNRADSPLIIAEGAKVLDNSNLTPEEQFSIALGWALDEITRVN